MLETIIIFLVIFAILSIGLWFFIHQAVSKRREAISGKFDFDAFKARETDRRGVHDITRRGQDR